MSTDTLFDRPTKHSTIDIGYFSWAFRDTRSQIRRSKKVLEPVIDTFDSFVGRGLSGTLVVPILGRYYGKHWGIVRKPKDNAHTSRLFEGEVGLTYCFVDDFMSTGKTLRDTKTAVESAVRNREFYTPVFIGAYLYEYGPYWKALKELRENYRF